MINLKIKALKKKNKKLTIYGLLAATFTIVLAIVLMDIYHDKSLKSALSVEGTVDSKRNKNILQNHPFLIKGIDVSHYNGDINWKEVGGVYGVFPIDFVFVRATVGTDKDNAFTKNWKALKKEKMFRGAYHYYRPNENSTIQANNFIASVKLDAGDLYPVLDIEQLPTVQSMDRLRVGLQNWLNIVERHYGVKPIIYTGRSYYKTNLLQHFSSYTIWIAAYTPYSINEKWSFWQFSETGRVKGINGAVDLNLFNGDLEGLKQLTIQY